MNIHIQSFWCGYIPRIKLLSHMVILCLTFFKSYLLFLKFLLIFIFWLHCVVCALLVPQLGIEPTAPAGAAQNINCWTTRQVPRLNFFEELPDYTPERSFSTLYSHRQHMRVWIFLHPLQHLFSVFYLLLQPSQWNLIVVLIGIFLMVNDFEYLVMCLLGI